ncbi:MAG: hypothetical protein QF701_09350, partial [Nitrospinota bacterium]|nr:hypothetical protein [Nitrospinota bacterium]
MISMGVGVMMVAMSMVTIMAVLLVVIMVVVMPVRGSMVVMSSVGLLRYAGPDALDVVVVALLNLSDL